MIVLVPVHHFLGAERAGQSLAREDLRGRSMAGDAAALFNVCPSSKRATRNKAISMMLDRKYGSANSGSSDTVRRQLSHK